MGPPAGRAPPSLGQLRRGIPVFGHGKGHLPRAIPGPAQRPCLPPEKVPGVRQPGLPSPPRLSLSTCWGSARTCRRRPPCWLPRIFYHDFPKGRSMKAQPQAAAAAAGPPGVVTCCPKGSAYLPAPARTCTPDPAGRVGSEQRSLQCAPFSGRLAWSRGLSPAGSSCTAPLFPRLSHCVARLPRSLQWGPLSWSEAPRAWLTFALVQQIFTSWQLRGYKGK